MNSACVVVLAALIAAVCAQYAQQQYGQPTTQYRQYTTAANQYQNQQYQQQPQYNQQQQQQLYNQQNQFGQTTQNPYGYANTQTSNMNRQYDQNGQPIFFNSVSPVSATVAALTSAVAMLLL